MRSVLFLLYCLAASAFITQGQTAWKPLLSPYIKTAGYSKLHSDVLSSTANQAALANSRSFSVGVFGERKFLLEELNCFSAVAALPTNSGVFALQLHQLGHSSFAQSQAGLAYARSLSKQIDVGVQFNYYGVRINGYGNASALNFEAGAVFHFTGQLHLGFHISNPAETYFGKMKEEKLPSVYSMGFGYDVSEHFFIGTEIEKTEDKNLDVNASLQYRFTDRVQARGGISSGTSILFFGLGIKVADFRIDVTASLHPQLGITPGLLFMYNKPVKE